MAAAFSQLAGAPLANLMIVAGLACIAIAIFGWASGTIAAGANFRTFSGLLGALLLFYVYGIYSSRAAHGQGAQACRTAQAQIQDQIQEKIAEAQPSQAPAQQPSSQPQSSQQSPQANQQSAQPAPQPALQDPFSGKWKNADPKAASILFLKVEEQGDALTVRAWGMCLPQQANKGLAGAPASQFCDWGTGHGVVSGGAAKVTWEQGPVLRRMRLLPAAGTLRVVLDSTYRDRRPPQHTEARFAKSL